jgi:hypothetical protein
MAVWMEDGKSVGASMRRGPQAARVSRVSIDRRWLRLDWRWQLHIGWQYCKVRAKNPF